MCILLCLEQHGIAHPRGTTDWNGINPRSSGCKAGKYDITCIRTAATWPKALHTASRSEGDDTMHVVDRHELVVDEMCRAQLCCFCEPVFVLWYLTTETTRCSRRAEYAWCLGSVAARLASKEERAPRRNVLGNGLTYSIKCFTWASEYDRGTSYVQLMYEN